MSERLFGIETEYAISPLGDPERSVGGEGFALRFMNVAAELFPHLRGYRSYGMFLTNGGLLYLDCGGHPEIATPEVCNPWDACRYVAAGERIVANVAKELARRDPHLGVFVTRCNVSYGGAASTWACHESYCHRSDPYHPRVLPDLLIPHLVSRVIYTGCGGFDNRSRGLKFMISPRVAHLSHVISGESQNNRGIYHNKDESLNGAGYHRLHLLCGESVCSQTSAWLKVAATALVVALIEAGLLRRSIVQLQSPLAAMRRFAEDVTCTARVPVYDGRTEWTAIELQRQYLREAERYVDHPVMPSWAPEACRRWGEILNRLEQGPQHVATILDWGIKYAVYQRFLDQHGIEWSTLGWWNQVIDKASEERRLLTRCGGSGLAKTLICAFGRRHAEFEQLEHVLQVRDQLFEIDTRFGELGRQGIFAGMEAAGALEHRVEGVDGIDDAISNPPSSGRACLRGDYVKRLRGTEAVCDWTGVWDCRRKRFLDLSDPFASRAKWRQIDGSELLPF
ncbi:MAG: proteasome accessory factor PafA2 family protein [Planctomycetaceae bacterium]|nr:proteasome accessory factor PafA2 family protein [Planctomycetaceae bacterium]